MNNDLNYHQALLRITELFKMNVSGVDDCIEKLESAIMTFTQHKNDGHYYFGHYASLHGLSENQQIILATALVAYTYPVFYFSLLSACHANGDNTIGTYNDNDSGTVYPTIQTLLLVLNSSDSTAKTGIHELMNDPLFKTGVLIATPLPGLLIKNNPLNHVVSIGHDYLPYFFTGQYGPPQFSASFPAQKITTKLSWDDLVLDGAALQQVKEITLWYKHRDLVLNQWQLNKMLNPGYKVLFYGPPGTGKSLTAAMIGKELGVDVYRIDLSMVVSKYIGETEKNLSSLFDRAMDKDWILFFDEADALFGSRTDVQDAHDRYANQEVSYLLQRLESYTGIVILASNLKGNIDKAFSRRFQNMIKFKVPDVEQRKRLWTNSFSASTVLEEGFPLNDLAKTYELAGGSIINVVQYASLKAAGRGNNIIAYPDVKAGVIRELGKDGKTP